MGAVLPFANIVGSEETHIPALVNLFARYGVQVPADPYEGMIPFEGTRQQACRLGVQAEIDNAALYDALLKVVEHRDIANVFTNCATRGQPGRRAKPSSWPMPGGLAAQGAVAGRDRSAPGSAPE